MTRGSGARVENCQKAAQNKGRKGLGRDVSGEQVRTEAGEVVSQEARKQNSPSQYMLANCDSCACVACATCAPRVGCPCWDSATAAAVDFAAAAGSAAAAAARDSTAAAARGSATAASAGSASVMGTATAATFASVSLKAWCQQSRACCTCNKLAAGMSQDASAVALA